MSDAEQLIARWRAEERAQPSGWSFADLEGRMRSDSPPWDFARQCAEAVARASRLLDMGTGGGETLLALRRSVGDEAFPAHAAATEGWRPNLAVARAALAPVGIDVLEFGQPDDDPAPAPMPFPDNSFDLVLNRHEAYHPVEVRRILTPGGTFLTQQVGGDELEELHALLDFPPAAPQVTYERFRQGLLDAGLTVTDGAAFTGRYTFVDVAAVVAYLQRVPWDAPDDFTVDRYAEQLIALHRRADGGEISLTQRRFWLEARR